MQTLPLNMQAALTEHDFDAVITPTHVGYVRTVMKDGIARAIHVAPVLDSTRIIVAIHTQDGSEANVRSAYYDGEWVEARSVEELELVVSTIALFA
ncbi:hypothetical protein ACMX2H_18340 [Arthrobacter sulfonylureivorans]|uniref:hypothetical protein n=1 Tax=Arthrobacter sulfonylureivorans TaxID=2486855 RepID=UPI0039E37535